MSMRYIYRLDNLSHIVLLWLFHFVALSSALYAHPTPQHYPLNDQAKHMAGSQEGREFIKYLADCALPQGVTAFTDIDGERYEFPGAIGLAPQWIHSPLSVDEQRWVSACILARVNYFGVAVMISMRNEHSPFTALQTSAQEREEFTIYEGDFFGNVFADPPVAGVTPGHRSIAQQDDPVLQLRVCTVVDPNLPPMDGKPLSRCRFIITGSPDDPDAHSLHNQHYDQYIRVYLKPQAQPSSTPPVPYRVP